MFVDLTARGLDEVVRVMTVDVSRSPDDILVSVA